MQGGNNNNNNNLPIYIARIYIFWSYELNVRTYEYMNYHELSIINIWIYEYEL